MTGQITQAERWIEALKQRTADWSGLEGPGVMQKIVDQLQADYPHQYIRMTCKGDVIGMRRLFGDRSYCDQLFADNAIGRMTYGTLTAGMVGTAMNGRLIQ